MVTIDVETIEERIKVVRIEQAVLQQNFDAMIARFTIQTEEHNKQVTSGQQRFQQLAGMLAELEYLKEQLLKTDPPANGEAPPVETNRIKKEKK